MIKEKIEVDFELLIALERAASLQITTNFEDGFIADLKIRFKTYGMKMVITKDQIKILRELEARYNTKISKL